MPTPEELKAYLKRFENPRGSEELRSRLQSLPSPLARIGTAFLNDLTGRWDDERAPERKQDKRAIEGLTDKNRRLLFGALFPSIARHVEASWRLQMRLPYQVGYLRKAFRAPLHPEYTAATRADWLESLLRVVLSYHYDLDFLTVWARHLPWGAEPAVGVLLAGVLDSDDGASSTTYTTLVRILNGEHEFATPSRHSVTALLCSSRPDAWGVVESLLLAAQRQEGLRQVVLESVDFAHRDAFTRMLRLIANEKLSRFAAVARAVAVWFGMQIDSEQTTLIDSLIFETLENLEDEAVRARRIGQAKGQTLYLALWAQAFDDVTVATGSAAAAAQNPDFDRRYAAVHLLAQLGTAPAARALRVCLGDADLRVSIKAAEAFPSHVAWRSQLLDADDTFEALRELLPRVPEDRVLPPAIWEWNRIRAKQADIAAKLIAHRDQRPFAALAPYLSAMDADGRRVLLRSLKEAAEKRKALRPDERDLTLSLIGDPSNAVRQETFEILAGATLAAHEAIALEPLLARKASDLRRGVIRLLLKQSLADCRSSVERLAGSGDSLMRQAAEEIRSELDPKDVPAASLHDGLGLFDPDRRTQPVAPRPVLSGLISSASSETLLHSLDDLVHQHRETPVSYKAHNGEDVHVLFGNLLWVDPNKDYPLGPVWNEWWLARKNGVGELNLARALFTAALLPEDRQPGWVSKAADGLIVALELRYRYLVRNILWFLVTENGAPPIASFLLDAVETYLQRISESYNPNSLRAYDYGPRTNSLSILMRVIESCRVRHADAWSDDLWRRYWAILRWIDESMWSKDRQRPALEVTMAAHKRGIASDADVYEQLLSGRRYGGFGPLDLAFVTKRKPNKLFETYPALSAFANRCRDRVLEVELKRGDLPTAASPAALGLSAVFGGELAVGLLKLLGRDPLSRGYCADNESKSVVFSHLLRVCLPAASDTPDSFAQCAASTGISQKRLVDLALYAPQWAAYVEHATGIVGLEDAAFWLHAHTKDPQWTVEPEIREIWFAAVSERTPLPREELLNGAVDVEWFQRTRRRFSAKDWRLIFDSAKFASGGAGHKRAQLFADAISGECGAAELTSRIGDKRNQDAVRAIGLAPLPPHDPPRRREVLKRYELLQRFLRESKKFGALRQTSEKQAYSIGLANLARTAGYPDPQRLSWAMEAEAIADLKSGPIQVVEAGVKATLSINTAGEPGLAFEKNGKPLKDLPPSLRKSPALSELRARKTALSQQTSRMRQSLEEAMIRGDRFTPKELAELVEHPLLRPMVASLLFAAESGEVRWFTDLASPSELFRIAHPIDLLNSGRWPSLQRECLEAARIQPFKQAFRELYVLTAAERDLKTHSGRYEGHQVNPKQALAVLGKRGWVNVPDEGVRKTFHQEGLSVWSTFLEGWFTPAEVDGLTVQHVRFTRKVDGKPVALDQVCPRLFSESMRDLDLVVSVAHRGGVDPEATASTVEMRSALVRETLALLKIANVRLKDQYAFVDGRIGNYNIHLGSGTVHRQPGGSLCIIPVHSQHRGRLFLPFADNDPKTAEIVSKVVLLAQDDKIKDPTILEQLR